MRLTDVFSAEAVAYRQTSDMSNPKMYIGQAFWPNKKKMGIDLKWIKTHKGLGIALKPSALDSLATIRPRKGFESITQEMPFFRESMTIKEQDLAEIQRAQESNDPYLNEVLGHVYDDADELIKGAEISTERMRMNLLAPLNGDMKLTIGMADNTLYSYNYDSDGSWKKTNYLEITSSGDKWDAPETSKPLNDIQKAKQSLSDIGVIATYAMMTSKTFNYLIESAQIKNVFITTSGKPVDFVDDEMVKELFRRKTGLTPIINNDKFTDYDGTQKGFFPDNYVSVIGSGILGNTWYGVTPEERTLLGDPKVNVSILESGVAVAVQTVYGPPAQYSTTASQIVLPSYEGMDSVYLIKVA